MRGTAHFITIAPGAVDSVIRPDWNGEKPKPTCSISGNRNGSAPSADPEDEAAADAGEEARQPEQREVDHRCRDPPRVDDIGVGRGGAAEDQRRDDAPGRKSMPVTVRPNATPPMPSPTSTMPQEVERLARLGAHVLDVAGDQHDAESPIGTLIRKIQCQVA